MVTESNSRSHGPNSCSPLIQRHQRDAAAADSAEPPDVRQSRHRFEAVAEFSGELLAGCQSRQQSGAPTRLLAPRSPVSSPLRNRSAPERRPHNSKCAGDSGSPSLTLLDLLQFSPPPPHGLHCSSGHPTRPDGHGVQQQVPQAQPTDPTTPAGRRNSRQRRTSGC